MANSKEQNRLTDWIVTALVVVVTLLLAAELGMNIHDSRDGSQTCISAESAR